MGTGAIAKVNRGITKEIATPYHRASPECIGCTACAQVCPTGQIEYEQDEAGVTIWDKRFEYLVCSSCGKPFMTREQYDFMKTKREMVEPPLCDGCEKRQVAERLAKSSQDYDVARLSIEELMQL
jgi:ferredoxin